MKPEELPEPQEWQPVLPEAPKPLELPGLPKLRVLSALPEPQPSAELGLSAGLGAPA
jgi:hypothetical protein